MLRRLSLWVEWAIDLAKAIGSVLARVLLGGRNCPCWLADLTAVVPPHADLRLYPRRLLQTRTAPCEMWVHLIWKALTCQLSGSRPQVLLL